MEDKKVDSVMFITYILHDETFYSHKLPRKDPKLYESRDAPLEFF